jgi:hypothetical protein
MAEASLRKVCASLFASIATAEAGLKREAASQLFFQQDLLDLFYHSRRLRDRCFDFLL